MKSYRKQLILKVLSKRIALTFFAFTGYLLGLSLWQKFLKRKNAVRILRYHSISDSRRHEVNVKCCDFRRQMEHLAKFYNPISVRGFIEARANKNDLPQKSVVVTFDDGYRDNFYNAYPILKSLNIPAMIFLTAGYIGTNKILPHDIFDNPEYNYLLLWDEVIEMGQGGIEFGSHTLSHANLGNQNLNVQREITESKRIIERELNSKVWAISYPFGLLEDFNQEVKHAAFQAGYTCGCSAMNGVNDFQTDIFELMRIGIEASDTMFTFKAKLNGALDLLTLKDRPLFYKLLKIFNKFIGV